MTLALIIYSVVLAGALLAVLARIASDGEDY